MITFGSTDPPFWVQFEVHIKGLFFGERRVVSDELLQTSFFIWGDSLPREKDNFLEPQFCQGLSQIESKEQLQCRGKFPIATFLFTRAYKGYKGRWKWAHSPPHPIKMALFCIFYNFAFGDRVLGPYPEGGGPIPIGSCPSIFGYLPPLRYIAIIVCVCQIRIFIQLPISRPFSSFCATFLLTSFFWHPTNVYNSNRGKCLVFW